MCFEKKKRSIEKEALKVQQMTANFVKKERESHSSDLEEIKRQQAHILQIERHTDGLQANLKAVIADFQRHQKSFERELQKAQEEQTRKLQEISDEATSLEKAFEDSYKV
jgi:hypothetical protein